MPKRLKVEVWSDIACPWCFIGKRRLETALREFPQGDEVEVEWRAFELDPRAPRVRDKLLTHNERLAKKYGTTVERAQAMNERLTGIAQEEGLQLNHRKTRCQSEGGRQTVCNIVVNQRPNLRRSEFDRLKAILHQCVRHGPEAQNREGVPNWRGHLRGRVAWASQLNPLKARRLQELYEQIDWGSGQPGATRACG